MKRILRGFCGAALAILTLIGIGELYIRYRLLIGGPVTLVACSSPICLYGEPQGTYVYQLNHNGRTVVLVHADSAGVRDLFIEGTAKDRDISIERGSRGFPSSLSIATYPPPRTMATPIVYLDEDLDGLPDRKVNMKTLASYKRASMKWRVVRGPSVTAHSSWRGVWDALAARAHEWASGTGILPWTQFKERLGTALGVVRLRWRSCSSRRPGDDRPVSTRETRRP